MHHPTPPLSLNPDLPTQVRLNRLAPLLTGYSINETQFLICGFQNGFPIHYDGPGNAMMAPNLLSAHQHPEVVDQYIEKELSSGRLAGPFPSSPFPYFRVSPLGVVPEKSPGSSALYSTCRIPQVLRRMIIFPQNILLSLTLALMMLFG